MMGGETPETCWATHKRRVINLWNCCISLVKLSESKMAIFGLCHYFIQWAMSERFLTNTKINTKFLACATVSFSELCQKGFSPIPKSIPNFWPVPLFHPVSYVRKGSHQYQNQYQIFGLCHYFIQWAMSERFLTNTKIIPNFWLVPLFHPVSYVRKVSHQYQNQYQIFGLCHYFIQCAMSERFLTNTKINTKFLACATISSSELCQKGFSPIPKSIPNFCF